MDPEIDNKATPFLEGLVVAALIGVLVGIVSRIGGVFGDLWLDEIWALAASFSLNHPMEIFNPESLDGHISFYTVGMHLLGWREELFLYRLPALCCGLLTVWFVWLFARKASKYQACLSLFLVSLSFPVALYSSEARGYAPMLCFGVLSVILMEKFLSSQRLIFGIFFPIAVLIAFLSHFTFALTYIALVIWSSYILALKEKSTKRRVGIIFGLHLVPLAVILVTYFQVISKLSPGTGSINSYWDAVFNTVAVTAGLPVLTPSNLEITGLILFVCFAFVVFLLKEIILLRRAGDPRWLFYFLVIFIMPLSFIIVIEPRVLVPRHLLMSIFFTYPLLAGILERGALKSNGREIIVIIVLIFFTAGSGLYLLSLVQYNRGQYSKALKDIASQSSSQKISIGSDHDFRNEMLIRYYSERMKGKEFVYIDKQDREKTLPEWYVVHSQDWAEQPKKTVRITDDKDVVYRFMSDYPYAGLSGWRWFLYKRTGKL